MAYIKTTWVNGGPPALSAENLNKMEDGIFAAINEDFIVEQGTSGIWTYRKWDSGISECWGHYTWNITSWTAWGGFYYSNSAASQVYPTNLFIDEPTFLAQGFSSEGDAFLGIVAQNSNFNTQTSQFYLLRPTSGPNATGHISIHSRGRWKL